MTSRWGTQREEQLKDLECKDQRRHTSGEYGTSFQTSNELQDKIHKN